MTDLSRYKKESKGVFSSESVDLTNVVKVTKKTGRPTMHKDGKKLVKLVQMYFTQEEYDKLFELADGVPMSAFIRRRIKKDYNLTDGNSK
ncbi:MAG: hypothetical protein LBQ13_01560 [Endomicrobium sp.]|jgi:hypothetical protein|nr:hypothetical protein [Endomicrobium sp.]